MATVWVTLECPTCGHEEETAAEWLERNLRLICPRCGEVIPAPGDRRPARPDRIPHIVIEVRGGVVQFVDGFNSAKAARSAYPLLTSEFTDEPKTGVRYVVLDHDDRDEQPPAGKAGGG